MEILTKQFLFLEKHCKRLDIHTNHIYRAMVYLTAFHASKTASMEISEAILDLEKISNVLAIIALRLSLKTFDSLDYHFSDTIKATHLGDGEEKCSVYQFILDLLSYFVMQDGLLDGTLP